MSRCPAAQAEPGPNLYEAPFFLGAGRGRGELLMEPPPPFLGGAGGVGGSSFLCWVYKLARGERALRG